MLRTIFCVCAASLLILSSGAQAATILASDNAANSPYNDGWQVGDNGGTGFAGWSTINNQSGTGSGGGFLANNNTQSQINTGGKAFGIFGHSGGTGQAIRSFSNSMNAGQSFSLDMDNGSIAGGATVGFGLQNSAGQNLFEFFFVGAQSEYRVNRSGGSVGTGVGFTNQGLNLDFTLTGANSFSFQIHRLVDSPGTNTVVTGNLITQAGGQAISRMRLFNSNAGQPNENNLFFNSFSIESNATPVADDEEIFNVMANDLNNNPVLHTFTASDLDNDILTWSNFQFGTYAPAYGGNGTGPAIAADFDTGTKEFSWNTTGSPRGIYTWNVNVSDGEASDIGTLTIHVTAVPEPATIALCSLAMIGLAGSIRRRAV